MRVSTTRYRRDNNKNAHAKIDSDLYLDEEIFPDKYRNANVYLASTVSVCVGRLRARYEDQIPTMSFPSTPKIGDMPPSSSSTRGSRMRRVPLLRLLHLL